MTNLDFFGEGAAFDHVGIVVKAIKEVTPHEVEIFLDPIQRVRVAFVKLSGAPVELIEPTSDNSPVSETLRKGHKLAHLCFSVPKLESAISSARGNGFSLIAQPVPAVAFAGQPIAWLFHREFGLVELVERASSSAAITKVQR